MSVHTSRAHGGVWKINVSSGPGKEIAGLKKKKKMMMMMMMKMMTPGSQDSRVWEFSHGPLECFGEFLKPS